MSYRIVHPVAMPIDANDFRDAVKKFIKLNHFMNIEQIILSDQYNHMKANVKYYDDNNRRKASIQLIPIDTIPSYVGFSSNNPNAPYPTAGFAVGPSMVGGPAGIIAPAGPLMVERPAMIGGPIIGGPMIGGPMIGIPGGPGVAGVIYGARPSETPVATSNDIIRIDEINKKLTAITKDGSTFPILKIQKVNNNQYKVTGPGGKTSMIKTEIIDGDRITFKNKKYQPDDEENSFDLTDLIDKTPAPAPAPVNTGMTFGPTAVITPNKQIIQVAPVQHVGTTPNRMAIPIGAVPGVMPSGVIGMPSGPRVVVGGPRVFGQGVRFGRGVY